MKKKVLATILATVLAVTTLVGCGSSETPTTETTDTSTETEEAAPAEEGEEEVLGNVDADKTIEIWSFSDEVKKMIEDYYLVDNPDLDYKINVTIVPTDSYQTKLDPALADGSGPDMFAVEAQYALKYTNSDITMKMSDLGIEDSELDAQLDYVKDVVRDADGNLKGISWQACPGAFFYRRDLAQEYLGVSEPAEVQELVKDWDTFLATAETLKTASNGEVAMVSGPGEVATIFYANKENPWIVDNTFMLSDNMKQYMEIAKQLQDGGYTKEAAPWSEGWFAGMKKEGNVFGYCLPTWGLHYVLKTNAEDVEAGTTSAGEWGCIQGPGAYFNGGTWLVARQGTEMQAEVADLIRYITTNEEFLTNYAKNTGDVLANQNVANAVKGDFSEEFLGGQNHYEMFTEMAQSVDASKITGEDGNIQNLFGAQVDAYIRGEKDMDTAIADFKSEVQNAYPTMTVE